MPAPEIPAKPGHDGELQKWSGNPLQKKNLGAHLTGVLYCQVGDPHKWEAELVVDQDDVDFVHDNQTVSILLDEIPYRTFTSTITEIGPELKVTPRQLSSKSGGDLMSKSDETGQERPLNTSYRARAPIDDPDAKLVQGLRGTAKVYGDWQPLGKRVWRYLIRTFNFKL